jgi:iron complex transport system substrate-binding protein
MSGARIRGRALPAVILAASSLAAAFPAAAFPAAASAATPAPAPFTVTDALNRVVRFARPPARIVVAGRAEFMISDALFLFPEARLRVVGVGEGVQTGRAFLPLVDPGYAGRAQLQSGAGAEQIAPLRPDVVLLKSGMSAKLGAPLEQLGVPVVYVDLETPAQYVRDIAVLGRLLGNPRRADEILRYFAAQAGRVRAVVEGVPESARPRVLLLQHNVKGGQEAFNVPPATWIQTELVEMAGGIPVWKDAARGGGWTVVGLEQIAAWDADRILLVDYRGNAGQDVARLKGDPRWQALRAVREGRLEAFAGDFHAWDQPDTRWPLGLLWLATRLHPDRTRDIHLPAEVERFYREMYGLSGATIRDRILPLAGPGL